MFSYILLMNILGLLLLFCCSLTSVSPIFFKQHHKMDASHKNFQNYQLPGSSVGGGKEGKRKQLTIQLINNHVQFKVPIEVEGIRYNLTIDTGSSAFFIKGEESLGSPAIKYHSNEDYMNRYKLHSLSYMDGTVQLYEQELKVSFSDYQEVEMPILVSYESPIYFSLQDGLIGLTFPDNKDKDYSFLKTLVREQIIEEQVFALNLNLIDTTRSFITFGSDDPIFYQGPLKTYPFNSKNAFTIDIKGASFEDSRIISLNSALLDSGTTCLTFPRNEQDYIANIFNQRGNKCIWLEEGSDRTYSYNMLICRITNFQVLPSIKFYIGSEVYTIQKEYYFQYCLQHQQYYFCDTYIEVGGQDEKEVVLGDSFLHRYYTLFSLDDGNVGIAKNRESIQMEQLFNVKDKETQFDPDDWQQLSDDIQLS